MVSRGLMAADGVRGPLRVLALGLLGAGVHLIPLASGHRMPTNSNEANVVDRALQLFVEGPNPRWFVYPSLPLYVVALGEGLLFGARRVLQFSPSPQSL